jgi:hypothetical protein
VQVDDGSFVAVQWAPGDTQPTLAPSRSAGSDASRSRLGLTIIAKETRGRNGVCFVG